MLRRVLRKAIREAVKQKDITVYSIATASGVDQSQLTRFLADERDLRLETAERVARYLGLELIPKKKRPKLKPRKKKRRGRPPGTKNAPKKQTAKKKVKKQKRTKKRRKK